MCHGYRKSKYCRVNISFRGMRSGTLPHMLAVGLGAACEVAKEEMEVFLLILFRVISFLWGNAPGDKFS